MKKIAKNQKVHSVRSRVIAGSLLAAGAFTFLMLASGTTLGPVGVLGRDALDWLVGGMAYALPVELLVAGAMLLGDPRRTVLATIALAAGDAAVALAGAAVFQTGVLGGLLGGACRALVASTGTALVALAVLAVVLLSRTSLVALATVAAVKRVNWKRVGAAVAAYARTVHEMAWTTAQAKTPSARRAAQAPVPTPPAPVAVRAVIQAVPSEDKTPLAPTVNDVVVQKPAVVGGGYRLPALDVLGASGVTDAPVAEAGMAERLVALLGDYGVAAKVARTLPGPTVTTYEVSVAAGCKISKLCKLGDELSLAMGCKVRVVPSRAGLVGFEIPNAERQGVSLRALVESSEFQNSTATLPVVLGRDMQGRAVYGDLAAMPHVIVAGASGAGKSVGLNVMLASLLCKKTPDELRFIMIDPKVVELAPFANIPHMLMPVVTDMKEAAGALAWAVQEMERRYTLFAGSGAKNIASYNGKVARAAKLPSIVVVIDEFADLIMQEGKAVETSVTRLGQKARAAGMHVILATQRPSVDVITGIIKANFSSRIAFRVAQAVDSRTILDEQGAETLLGAGDMLVKLNGALETKRVQCPFISEEQVDALTRALRGQGAESFDKTIRCESPFAAEWKKSRMVQLMPAVAS